MSQTRKAITSKSFGIPLLPERFNELTYLWVQQRKASGVRITLTLQKSKKTWNCFKVTTLSGFCNHQILKRPQRLPILFPFDSASSAQHLSPRHLAFCDVRPNGLGRPQGSIYFSPMPGIVESGQLGRLHWCVEGVLEALWQSCVPLRGC